MSAAVVSRRSLTRIKTDAGGVGDAPRRHQDVAALDFLLAGRRPRQKADLVSGSAAHVQEFGGYVGLYAFVGKDPPDLL
jgi:hypothetical protein